MTDRMTTSEAAIWLRYAPSTLAKWRYEGKGPAYLKEGRTVWYYPQDLDTWDKQMLRVKPRKVR